MRHVPVVGTAASFTSDGFDVYCYVLRGVAFVGKPLLALRHSVLEVMDLMVKYNVRHAPVVSTWKPSSDCCPQRLPCAIVGRLLHCGWL
jgi:hypothetical protein